MGRTPIPWYGYEYGWEPGAETYELGPFDYDRLTAPRPGEREVLGAEAALEVDGE